MNTVYTNRQWRLISRPVDMLTIDNFEQTEEIITEIKDNQALIETNYLSFDPTQRIWSIMDSYVPKIPLNDVMRAFGMGQVIASKHPQFRIGDFVYGNLGWQDYKIIEKGVMDIVKPQVIPGFLDPITMTALSITGVTAYIGIEKLAKVRAGDKVLVSGAAGAVGSTVCQIAKIRGAYVVGIAGGQEKCDFITHELGVDIAIDYKAGNVEQQIKSAFPEGIDIYFDNVGGDILEISLTQLRKFARVILCGAISQYNDISEEKLARGESPATKNIFNLIAQSASIQGFVILDYMHELTPAVARLHHWLKQDKFKLQIDMQEGFENIPQTLCRLFEGKNIGKQLLTLKEPSLPANSNGLMKHIFNLSLHFYR